MYNLSISRHFGSYQESKLSVSQRKERYSTVKSSQFSWAGQYQKYVFQFTLEYSDISYSVAYLRP